MCIVITCKLPCTGYFSGYCTVGIKQGCHGRLGADLIDVFAMVHELVRSFDFARSHCGDTLARIAERTRKRPAVLIHEHLVHANLMRLAAVREAAVEEVEHFTRFVKQQRVMAGRHIAVSGEIRLCVQIAVQEVADQLDAMIRQPLGAAQHRVLSECVFIRAFRILGTEQTHVIPAASPKPAVSNGQIVVSVILVIDDKRSFSRLAEAAGNLRSEIPVDQPSVSCRAILSGIFGLTGRRIDFKHEDPARPGAVRHPELAVLVIEQARIDGVRVNGIGKRAVRFEPAAVLGAELAVADQRWNVGIRPFLVDRAVRILTAVLREAGIDQGPRIRVRAFNILRNRKSNRGTDVC
ncbi:hypothetical protein D3C75_389690 [compost metagenome]